MPRIPSKKALRASALKIAAELEAATAGMSELQKMEFLLAKSIARLQRFREDPVKFAVIIEIEQQIVAQREREIEKLRSNKRDAP